MQALIISITQYFVYIYNHNNNKQTTGARVSVYRMAIELKPASTLIAVTAYYSSLGCQALRWEGV